MSKPNNTGSPKAKKLGTKKKVGGTNDALIPNTTKIASGTVKKATKPSINLKPKTYRLLKSKRNRFSSAVNEE